MRRHHVQCLLMGGQACVFYGAAEFSRNTDLAILASDENLDHLRAALAELQAEVIAVPGFEIEHLHRGHAIHFRCRHPDAAGMRVDVMSSMRGVAPFPELWERRTTLETPDGTVCDLLSLPDLVQATKTQRDKDWPMIRRLVEAHYFERPADPTPPQILFWLRELRTASLLIECAARWPEDCRQQAPIRESLRHAWAQNESALESALAAEEQAERLRDKEYWLPLKKELEAMRRAR
ncbi:hypothetical protein OKA05_15845 [Luteolibacter arcticus]|uniref:Nucleotidyltransferase n=1 Tax=Luteolibacter arcticus TaxID=1581411 RepID=A0ABT3GKI9_9BACT|nr:hypothetical protein [Luteolibacter arcticus]MCW1924040.1 hypothetical protein [Luteolibacter arcticus]